MAEDSESEARLAEIPAEEILDKFQKGEPVIYDRVRIEGDLNLRMWDLPTEYVDRNKYESQIKRLFAECKIVSSPIEITNSEIKGTVNFSRCIFKVAIDFGGTTFSGNANFAGTTFSGNATFGGATFNKGASFWGATFGENADFAGDFGGTTFSGKAIFMLTTFGKGASFWGATFGENADFREATFRGNAEFMRVTFGRNADFMGATFSRDASFTYSNFQNNSDFSNSKFDKLANFRSSDFQSGSLLNFKEIDFERIFFDWNSIENLERHFDSKIYLSLIESYKNRGFFEDADSCYYQSRLESRESLRGLYKLADWIIWALYGYGVKPKRPLFGLGIVLVIFWFSYYVAFLIYDIAENATLIVDAFNLSSVTLLSGSKLIDAPTYPVSGYWWYWMFTLEKLLGSLFFGLLLVSFGKTITR
jgi:hypothetical protein